ncbi:5-formyltetrahydrofolate cyclo-ligase [Pseudosulfitobacter pseudonitzschiae]|uniref:5-formyltetrahydrofolate cyclo-ligase n=1 Tax=Pseudosulfitobacter pseudonitzschiae TaxID=1402135 RepID=UPI001AF3C896|nr:5-formyltetrahydrofolate cyclo-ligase [Pseudosulfitobacter pseudonitzschiae]MBM1815238.1 5-formyltetrahydrofolate cyclo-ligase [Pseudosulfitobacter pseudonitzschiae]MBM1832229.1 5-formyltetrahydrofolate cyclo-ligase [Pseudosulfitobacter pseudonitzschiae]MBM1837097.1 5-formyltetrahydrofolate cyclo-ligase [Pseudosulfitobacter pseudonitzschiae]MBM1841943.1 5-formyltetrahydrofolate cyclo-ligase [Pseudosulfitobacter pseudonitzschiae]MBM1846811.1 5-formyltetrahydrofolate cyclo-ligase [Pseudosulfi
MTLEAQKAAARKAAFARRKAAYETAAPDACGVLSELLAGHRGVPLAGYVPIRTEIDPLAAMAEASAYGPVGVPVIQGAGQPLQFSQWEPDMPLRDGPFGARVPMVDAWMVPQIVIVPLVAFDRRGGRLGYGGGFYDRTLQGLRARGPVLAVGFAFAAQEAEALPLEETDQTLDMIVTEADVIQF